MVYNLKLKQKDDKHSVNFSHQIVCITRQSKIKNIMEIIKKYHVSFLESNFRAL